MRAKNGLPLSVWPLPAESSFGPEETGPKLNTLDAIENHTERQRLDLC
jgi:hypothetical protein